MSFLFVICQAGAERAVKDEVSSRYRGEFRFSYSRPGFVTFRIPDEVRRDRSFALKSAFARTWGFSIGKVSGTDGHQLCREAWQVFAERFPRDELAAVRNLHVYERDRRLPGDDGFEPGVSLLAKEVGSLLQDDCHPTWSDSGITNEPAGQGDRVLDCVIVEPGEWWLGWHRVNSVAASWPGGVPLLEPPNDMISRTWLKMAESLKWSGLPVEPGDACVEIGSAPGGSCQMLLGLGLSVTGIDPAEMDPLLTGNPFFTHLRARARDLKRRTFSGFRWLMSDASVAPNYTLDTIEAIVTHNAGSIEGMLLTLKLPDWKQAARIPEFHKRIRSWGYRYVRSRQLAYNRREICVAATRGDS